jgi:hypothetical protein
MLFGNFLFFSWLLKVNKIQQITIEPKIAHLHYYSPFYFDWTNLLIKGILKIRVFLHEIFHFERSFEFFIVVIFKSIF